MKIQPVLSKVFWSSNIVTGAVVILICLLLQWKTEMVLMATMSSFLVGAPAVISLQALCWIIKRIKMSRAFVWIILMASIPFSALIPASIFADTLPGDAGFLVCLGILSGYVGILGHGVSIAQLFNSFLNETE